MMSLSIWRLLSILSVLLLGLVGAAPVAAAEDAASLHSPILDKVRETGILVAGTRADSRPFAFIDRQGDRAGFSVDVLGEIRQSLETLLKRPITLELKTVTPETRIEMVNSGKIAIECGVTGPTWARAERVDFSIPFFVNGARVLARRSAAKTIQELSGKRVAVVRGGTELRAVEDGIQNPSIVEVADITSGMKLLEAGEVEGLSNISVVLRSLLEHSADQGALILLPRDGALIYEPLSCMLSHDEWRLRNLVNATIASMLVGAENYKGRYIDLYNKWFGPGTSVPIPLELQVIQRLKIAAFWLD